MPTSFLAPASPELAQAVSSAILHSYSIGKQEEAAKADKAFAEQQTQFVQQNENLRKQAQLHQEAAKSLLEEKAKSVKAAADQIAARINDNSTLIQSAPTMGRDPKAVERIAFDVRRDQELLSNINSGFANDPINFQLPNITQGMSALPSDYTATTPEFQAQQTAKSNEAQTGTALKGQELQSNALFASQNGGMLPNAVSAAGAEDMRKFRKTQTVAKLNVPKLVDPNGFPLNSVVSRQLQQIGNEQPALLQQYNSEHSIYSSASDPEEKKKSQTTLKRLEGKLRGNYEQLGRYVLPNASADERSFIGKLGLGLRADTFTQDRDILHDVISDTNRDYKQRGIAMNLYQGLGFGHVANSETYQPYVKNSTLFKYQIDDAQSSEEGLLGKY